MANIISGSKDLVGLPLHVLDSTAKVFLSFGTDEPTFRAGAEGLLFRSLVMRDSASVYAIHSQEYKIELWSIPSGQLIREFSRKLSWFEPWVQLPNIEDGVAPPAHTEDAFLDSQGRIWLNIQRPDRTFLLALVTGGLHGKTVRDMSKYLDSHFEVIDPVSATVLASRRFDEVSYGVFQGGLVFTSTVGADDEPLIKIWKLSLRSP